MRYYNNIKDFVDQIDSRRGFYHGIARKIDDFRGELLEADLHTERPRTESLTKQIGRR